MTRAETEKKLAELYLSWTDLIEANLSRAIGLLDPADWLSKNFEKTAEGILVFKRFGTTEFPQPQTWKIEPGSVITEVVNHDRCCTCACGINFGTRSWCAKHYQTEELWECLIRWIDLADVAVPYMTDGKARCGRMTLVRKV